MQENKLNDLKKKTKDHYMSLDSVYCPALKARVHFNSDGFYHMIYKSSREKRTVVMQRSRLILVPLLKPVIKNAKKINETRIEEVKIAGVSKIRTCYALVEYVGSSLDAKVKVVIRQIGSGNYYFHSAMKMNKNHRKPKTPPKG